MSALRHRVSILAILATLPLSGCGSMIRRAVNSKFPPVSPEQRQLGAIETAHKAIPSLKAPNSYAFIPTADLSNYVLTAAKYPFPLSADQDILATAPLLGSPGLTLGKQEIAFSSEFSLDLKGTHFKMDMSGIKVRGRVDVRLYPELVPSAAGGDILGVRLRPAITSTRITAIDFSSSKHSVLYWFQRRQALSTPINLALNTFRDNINGKLHLDVPFPLAPITVTSGHGGFNIQPAKLLAIQPGITSAVVRVSSKGLLLVSVLRIDFLDPNNLPKPQPPIVIPREPLPGQVSAAMIEREYSQLNQDVEGLVVKAFGAYQQDRIIASINKDLISDAFNKVFEAKQIAMSYSGALEEQKLQGNDALVLRFPKQSCLSNLAEFARAELAKPEIACAVPTAVFHAAEVPYNAAHCPNRIHDPVTCALLKPPMDAAGKIMDACNAHGVQLRHLVDAPEAIDQAFAKTIGREHFYQDVCPPNQNIGDLNGALSGVGPDAIKGNASMTGIHISKNMDSVQLDGVQADAKATVQGWASLNLFPPYSSLCPLPSAFGGPQSRFTLSPLTLEVASGSSTISATFGISSFPDDILNRERKGFFIDPASFDVEAKAGLKPIVKLLGDAAIKLSCTFDPAGASAFPLTELLSLAGTELRLKHGIDIKKTRIAWSDGNMSLPVSWTREGEKTVVDKTLPLNVNFELSKTTIFVTADPIPAPKP